MQGQEKDAGKGGRDRAGLRSRRTQRPPNRWSFPPSTRGTTSGQKPRDAREMRPCGMGTRGGLATTSSSSYLF